MSLRSGYATTLRHLCFQVDGKTYQALLTWIVFHSSGTCTVLPCPYTLAVDAKHKVRPRGSKKRTGRSGVLSEVRRLSRGEIALRGSICNALKNSAGNRSKRGFRYWCLRHSSPVPLRRVSTVSPWCLSISFALVSEVILEIISN